MEENHGVKEHLDDKWNENVLLLVVYQLIAETAEATEITEITEIAEIAGISGIAVAKHGITTNQELTRIARVHTDVDGGRGMLQQLHLQKVAGMS